MDTQVEETFIRRAIAIVKETQLIKEEKALQVKLGQLEGFLTGMLELFALASKMKPE